MIGLDELAQALRIIVTTSLGSVPLSPEFGCDLLPYLDRPTPQALPGIIRAVSRAVARWEPRVKLQKVQVVAGDQAHRRTLRMIWSPTESSITASSQTTEVAL